MCWNGTSCIFFGPLLIRRFVVRTFNRLLLSTKLSLHRYDFALFGFFSDVIATVFFPPSEESNNDGGEVDMGGEIDTSNLVRSFAVYGGAFLMRPVGGITIGHIGDKYGRKQALVLSLFLMAVPTFLMGCLPTYEQVGALSTILLVLCRLLQGMSVGGQLPASLIYTGMNNALLLFICFTWMINSYYFDFVHFFRIYKWR